MTVRIAVGMTIVPIISLLAGEELEHLEEREEVPLGPRRVVGAGGVGGGVEVGAALAQDQRRRSTPKTATLATVSMKSCSGQNWPVGPAIGVARRCQAVAAEQGDVRRQAEDEQGRQDADVQAVEPGERLVAVVGAADDHLLEVGADAPAPRP